MGHAKGSVTARLAIIASVAYEIVAWATFAKLMFFDNYIYTWWNWIIALPLNVFLGQVWPIYWLMIRPIFHK
jgi:hypothetical protein